MFGRWISIAVMFGAVQAHAWGPEGHEVIGDIATRHLTPAARRGVQALLGNTDLGAREVSSWADGWRLSHRETGRWHFVDIPISRATYDAAADCRGGECVVAKISAFLAVLRDVNTPAEERLRALKLLVHLVADLHQPLHCEDDGDAGGNDFPVVFERRRSKLHAVWDGQALRGLMGPAEASKYAGELDTRTPEIDAGGSPEAWANESHQVAQAIYAELGGHAADRAVSLPGKYAVANRLKLELQLVRAGRRLAALLNAAFAR